MTDTYDAVYNAIRSKVHFDSSRLIENIARMFDISWEKQRVEQAIHGVLDEWQRPSVLYRPELTWRGNEWLAAYGPITGAGNTPAKAMAAFDKAWNRPPAIVHPNNNEGFAS